MKTEESIRILLSLYIMIEQHYDAMTFYEKYLSEENFDNNEVPPREEDSIDESIIESLWFQIILKTSSFLDEWDNFLAVNTDSNDKEKLLLIKKIVAPARKEILKWKDLKAFRNEIVAHNMRNSKNEFILDNMHKYNCPKTQHELFYLVKFLERMIKILSHHFPSHVKNALIKTQLAMDSEKKYNLRDINSLKTALKDVDKNISSLDLI